MRAGRNSLKPKEHIPFASLSRAIRHGQFICSNCELNFDNEGTADEPRTGFYRCPRCCLARLVFVPPTLETAALQVLAAAGEHDPF